MILVMDHGNDIQRDVDTLLRRGVVFSIIWLFGIGYGAVSGMGRVWWCFVVGGLGLFIWIPLLAIGFVNNI